MLLAAALLAGCGKSEQRAPQRPPPQVGVIMVAPNTPDRMGSGLEGGTFVLTVYRVGGIGGAVLRAPAQGWPQAIVVRLHGFPELEGFSAKSARGTLQCGLQRPERQPPKRMCTLDAAPVDALRGDTKLFEVTLPAAMLTADSGLIEVRWVDYYR